MPLGVPLGADTMAMFHAGPQVNIIIITLGIKCVNVIIITLKNKVCVNIIIITLEKQVSGSYTLHPTSSFLVKIAVLYLIKFT